MNSGSLAHSPEGLALMMQGKKTDIRKIEKSNNNHDLHRKIKSVTFDTRQHTFLYLFR